MPFLTIREDTVPYVTFDGETTKAVYDHARVYVELLRSNYVRVTQRGVQFGIAEKLREVFSIASPLTHSVACARHPHALCETSDGVLVLPTGAVDFPGQPLPSKYLASFDGRSPCTSRFTGRVYNGTDTRYELSLCDVTDGRVDLIFDLNTQTLHWRQDTMTIFEFIVLAIAAVYLMSCTSVNIVRFVHRQKYRVNKYTLAAAGLVVFYCAVSLSSGNLRFVATAGDMFLMFVLCGFVLLEIVLQVTSATKDSHEEDSTGVGYVGGVSINIACLLLLTLPVHYSFDNPYTPVLTVLFGVRSWTRTVTVLQQCSRMNLLLLTGDLLTFAAVLQVGIGHTAHDASEAAAEQVQACFASIVFGQLVQLHMEHRGNRDVN